jgi:multicomponent Na+:H+ antiporter subunit B
MSAQVPSALVLVLYMAGVAVMVAAALGALVPRRIYGRLHFLTPMTSLGAPLIGLALAIQNGWGLVTGEILLIVALQAVTGPVLATAAGRVSAQAEGLVSKERHHTANVVSAVNFDQRALDTLGEETILIGSVTGAAVLLRPSREEEAGRPAVTGRVLESTQLAGYLLLPVTLIIGFVLVAHGHVTPGGGFQGGVVLATGLHLLYVTGDYRALGRLRPLALFDAGDALGAALFAALGIAGLVAAGAFLANILPYGTFGQLLSAGTVPLLNVAVGLEVGCGMVMLLAHFLDQEIVVYVRGQRRQPGEGR